MQQNEKTKEFIMKVETLINHELFKNKSKLMNTRFPVFN